MLPNRRFKTLRPIFQIDLLDTAMSKNIGGYMNCLKSILAICLITAYGGVSFSAEAAPCATDPYTMELITEAREDVDVLEISLQDGKGQHIGSLFTSTGKELYGHAMYVCGNGDNYFYVNSNDIRQWVGKEAGEWNMVSAIRTHQTAEDDLIHHDEALASASVETLELTDDVASVRMVFQAWNFANEAATTGVFYFQIPLK